MMMMTVVNVQRMFQQQLCLSFMACIVNELAIIRTFIQSKIRNCKEHVCLSVVNHIH